MKKRIIFVNGHLKTGGIERSLVNLLKIIDYNKYEVDLLLLEEKGEYFKELPDEVNVILASLKDSYGRLLSSVLRSIRNRNWFCLKNRIIHILSKYFGTGVYRCLKHGFLINNDYDLAVSYRNGISNTYVAYVLKADFKINWWHDGDYVFSTAESTNFKKECREIDTIVPVSNGCADMLKSKLGRFCPDLFVVPNIIDHDVLNIKAKVYSVYKEKGLYMICSVGRLSEEKHYIDVVYVAEYLIKNGLSNFMWYLVGDGEERARIQTAAKMAGVDKNIVFTGAQQNPYPYIKAADLFVHPSHMESQGLAVLEAMALGVPCVVTRSLGPCEFIVDGENGLLSDRNPESLAEKVLQILEDKELYSTIKKNTRCPQQFTPENVADKFFKLLEMQPKKENNG